MSPDFDIKEVLEPELWNLTDAILQQIPKDIDLRQIRSDAQLIDTLGRRRAFDALRAYQRALRHYFSDLVFQTIRASCFQAFEPRSQPPPLPSAQEWAQMFEVPW